MSVLKIRDGEGQIHEVLAIRGERGFKGEDAYAKAVENGFQGTEAEFYLILAQLQEELAGKASKAGDTLTGPLYYKSKSNEFLRTDNIVNWAIGNMDEWTPFFSYFNIARVQRMEYTGTGTYGEWNAMTFTFDFQPKLLIVISLDRVHVDEYGTEKIHGFNEVLMIAPYGTPGAVSSRYYASDMVKAFQTHLSWNGKTVSWWGSNKTRHLNCVRKYRIFALR